MAGLRWWLAATMAYDSRAVRLYKCTKVQLRCRWPRFRRLECECCEAIRSRCRGFHHATWNARTIGIRAPGRQHGGMSRYAKVGAVLAGYVVAFLVAGAAVEVWARMNPSPDASGGMQAFGDSLRVLGLFVLLALAPTGLALYFLRSSEKFWRVLSTACLALAATGPVFALMLGRHHASFGAGLVFGLFGTLRTMGAPLLGIGFLVCAAIAPTWRSRRLLLPAAAIEFAVGGYGYFCLWVLGHWAV